MDIFTRKLILGEKLRDNDLIEYFYKICDREHVNCSEKCPVFAVYNRMPTGKSSLGDIKNVTHKSHLCPCFKNGAKMLDYLRLIEKLRK